jgi:hypothetical protein
VHQVPQVFRAFKVLQAPHKLFKLHNLHKFHKISKLPKLHKLSTSSTNFASSIRSPSFRSCTSFLQAPQAFYGFKALVMEGLANGWWGRYREVDGLGGGRKVGRLE